MACLSAGVAVSLAGSTALDSNMTSLTTPKGDKHSHFKLKSHG